MSLGYVAAQMQLNLQFCEKDAQLLPLCIFTKGKEMDSFLLCCVA